MSQQTTPGHIYIQGENLRDGHFVFQPGSPDTGKISPDLRTDSRLPFTCINDPSIQITKVLTHNDDEGIICILACSGSERFGLDLKRVEFGEDYQDLEEKYPDMFAVTGYSCPPSQPCEATPVAKPIKPTPPAKSDTVVMIPHAPAQKASAPAASAIVRSPVESPKIDEPPPLAPTTYSYKLACISLALFFLWAVGSFIATMVMK